MLEGRQELPRELCLFGSRLFGRLCRTKGVLAEDAKMASLFELGSTEGGGAMPALPAPGMVWPSSQLVKTSPKTCLPGLAVLHPR